jgi:hypothetical protein
MAPASPDDSDREEEQMPKLPWTNVNPVDATTECTIMGSRLPLRDYRHVPSFLRWTLRIRRQLAASEGLVGYALDAQLTAKTFWTVSAWTSRADLQRFNRADPHRVATDTIHPWMLPSTFVFWTTTAGALPIEWDDVHRRIESRMSPEPGATEAENPDQEEPER